jgi:hypothetical protein
MPVKPLAARSSRGPSGVKDGDEVIIGPFNSVRDMKDGDAVKLQAAGAAKK